MPDASEPLNRVMVIAAHPDDPEFGCAGSIVKWAQAGKQITYVLLTSGDKGSHDPELRRELASLIRHAHPQIVITIDPWRHYQLHPDHRAAGQSALDAIYAAREWNIFPEQLCRRDRESRERM
jgi:LmbE family N-acetylglucosaminyl deacetylase